MIESAKQKYAQEGHLHRQVGLRLNLRFADEETLNRWILALKTACARAGEVLHSCALEDAFTARLEGSLRATAPFTVSRGWRPLLKNVLRSLRVSGPPFLLLYIFEGSGRNPGSRRKVRTGRACNTKRP